MVKKMMKIAGIVFIVLLIVGIGILVYLCYQNLHWWEKDMKQIEKLGVVERQVTLPNGNVINYGELGGDGSALLLIHGQMASWEDYSSVMPRLHENWHIYAIDVYGHGESTHEEEVYYLDINGDDIIWFIENVIQQETVVSGHSNGALTVAYVAAYGGDLVKGVVLEDPPVFSTQGEEVKIFFMPASATTVFHYVKQYDMLYGKHFYDLTWNNGITHEQLLSDIEIPCIYLHAKEKKADTGVYLCAASKEQAERAVALIGDNCQLIEIEDSNHNIHGIHTQIYLDAINSFLREGMLLTSTQVDEGAQHFYRKLGYKDCGGFVIDIPGYEQPMEMFLIKGI